MTLTKEQIQNEKRWNLKCFHILSYHLSKCEEREGVRNNMWRVEDTARELSLSVGFISESLKLAKALGKNDKLKYFSRDNALKYLRNE